ncbi:MAG TPA: hypothetical protein VKT73_16655 [Xanthobacteraceae bacterium]|nr:hypothetical protein [Xanthobacteraceae bacterium]
MGGFVLDSTALSILVQINARFGMGDPIQEMVALQKEFRIFSNKHSLRSSFALLHIAPPPGKERQRWFRYLQQLRTYPSDKRGVNGADRIVQTIQHNLEASHPLPMRLTVHPAKQNRAVTIKIERPIVFSKQKYVVVSVPTAGGREVREEIARHVRARRRLLKSAKR